MCVYRFRFNHYCTHIPTQTGARTHSFTHRNHKTPPMISRRALWIFAWVCSPVIFILFKFDNLPQSVGKWLAAICWVRMFVWPMRLRTPHWSWCCIHPSSVMCCVWVHVCVCVCRHVSNMHMYSKFEYNMCMLAKVANKILLFHTQSANECWMYRQCLFNLKQFVLTCTVSCICTHLHIWLHCNMVHL